MSNRKSVDEARVSIFCRCGAQWHGRYTIDNPLIDAHAIRCGAPVNSEAYRALGFTVKIPPAWKADARFREAGRKVDHHGGQLE